MTIHGSAKFLILPLSAALLLATASGVQAAPKGQDLPPAVRMVLSRIHPLLEQKQYQKVIHILTGFQARGGKTPEPGGRDPNGYHHPEIYFALGNCHMLQEQYQPAADAYRLATDRDPGHTFAWLNRAKAAYELKDYSQAATCFIRGYETSAEENPEYLYFAAAAHLMGDEPDRAIPLFRRLIQHHPAEVKPEWKEHYVHALLAVSQDRQALPVIRELAAIYSGEKKIQWQEILLHQYLRLEMQTAALELARQLVGQAPAEQRWWKALVHIHLNAEQLEEAFAMLTVYAFLRPLSGEEKRLMADLGLQIGLPVKAAPLYEDCLRHRPQKELIPRLVEAYRQLGQTEKALALLARFEPRGSDGDSSTELLMLRGDLLYTLARYDQAQPIFEKAARIKGDHRGRAWLMAGYAAWQQNDLSAGREAFTRAAQYASQKKAALAALDQLAHQTMQDSLMGGN